MVDLHTHIREQLREVLDIIAKSMNLRASEPAMQTICGRYMGQIALPEGGRVLEVGCGNGAATKLIMLHIDPAELVGIDPSPVFIYMAREAFTGEPRASFLVGDAVATGQAEVFFDLVIAHTVYSHLPRPRRCAGRDPSGFSGLAGSSSFSMATTPLLPSPCSMAIRCRRPSPRCCVISCTLPT